MAHRNIVYISTILSKLSRNQEENFTLMLIKSRKVSLQTIKITCNILSNYHQKDHYLSNQTDRPVLKEKKYIQITIKVSNENNIKLHYINYAYTIKVVWCLNFTCLTNKCLIYTERMIKIFFLH